MKEFKMFLNVIKEEKWLNQQLQKGYRCTKINVLGIYSFEKTQREYVIRLDYQEYLAKNKFEEYKQMYKDFGWNYITGYQFGGIKYWQKENDGQTNIFSDRESKANYYKRIMNYSLLFMIVSFLFSNDIFSVYATQGIWDLEGALFWKVFIFETPFALLKLAPNILAVLFAINYYRAYRQYAALKEK